MGDLLLNGEKGVEKNPSEAVWWYTMAAYQVFSLISEKIISKATFASDSYVLQGLPAGQYSLARCLERGEGTQKAPADAVHWYRLAVDASYAPAIEAMGM